MSRPGAAGRPTEEPTRLRVRRPGDYLAVIPYLLGFHPSESVVALLFRGGRVLVTARIDLPPPGLAAGVCTHLREMTTRHRVDELVLVAYATDLTAGRALVDRVLAGSPVRVRDALLVGGGRWWSLTCPTRCCPPEGSPYDPGGHRIAAEAVYAGLTAERDRSVLTRQVAGPSGPEERSLLPGLARARRQTASLSRTDAARLVERTVRRLRAGPDPAGDEDCLQLAVLVQDLVVRDVAWAMMSRRDSEDDLRVWGRVVARSPRRVAAGPLGLLGAAAWISGNGALQNCCVERLERLDPTYTLGVVLADISERALPPSAWDDMVEELRREVCAVAGLPGLH